MHRLLPEPLYVRPAHHNKSLPCHVIPLNAQGETVYSLLRVGGINKLEQALLDWRDEKIEKEPKERAAAAVSERTKGPA